MGQALLDGWLAGGLAPAAVSVLDPAPSERLQELAAQGLRLNGDLPAAPAACLLAVKPQQMADALPRVAQLAGGDTVFVSIAAGTTLAALEAGLGAPAPIIRAMPTPRPRSAAGSLRWSAMPAPTVRRWRWPKR